MNTNLNTNLNSNSNTRHIISFSGGKGSFAAALRVIQKHGLNSVTFLFTDTLMEDEDLYRFLIQTSASLSGIPLYRVNDLSRMALNLTPVEVDLNKRKIELNELRLKTSVRIPKLVWIQEGRTPWEVYRDVKFLGNSRVDPCSKILKRDISRKWLAENCSPESTIIYVGIDFLEQHRFFGNDRSKGFKRRMEELGWQSEAPLISDPLTPKLISLLLEARGISLPRLYEMGFAHNNCGGFCCKAGQGHFKTLLLNLPERFSYHAQQEQEFVEEFGTTMMLKMKDRKKFRYSLDDLARDVSQGEVIDKYEIGGCGCFLDGD